MFKVVFAGQWHGYNTLNHTHVLNAEEMGDLAIEDEGQCVRIQAGCRSQWFSHATIAKLGAACLEAARASTIEMQPFVFRLTPDKKSTSKELLLNSDNLRVAGQTVFPSGERSFATALWRLDIIPNPSIEAMNSLRGAEKAVLSSAVKRLVYIAKNRADEISKVVEDVYGPNYVPKEEPPIVRP